MKRNAVWIDGMPFKLKSVRVSNKMTEDARIDTRTERKSKMCFDYFKEFTENTTLHGFKYLGESGSSIVERIWWGVMIILSAAACGHLIFKLWSKWQLSPVIVRFADTSTPVWQISFPAITICSETKTRQSVYNYTEMYYRDRVNFTPEERMDFEAVSLLCDNHFLTEGSNFTNPESLDKLISVAPTFDEMMWVCKWKTSTIDNCSTLFSPILTDDGLCFSFNMLNAQELFRRDEFHSPYRYNYLNHGKKSEGWTLDGGYPTTVPLDTYPVRGTGSGTKAGLSILMRAYDYDLDYVCRGPVQGFKILLHNPSEIPRVSQQYFRVPLNQEVIVAIKPVMMTTSEGLRGYDPKRRQCFFPSERWLKYYRVYSQKNCDLECLTNYTLASCGCVSLSMPRDSSTLICSAGKVNCMVKAQEDLLTHEIQKRMAWQGMLTRARELEDVASHCLCLSDCTAISYDAETSQADFKWQKLSIANKLDFSELSDVNVAKTVLFFKESQFSTSKRSEQYGQTDFLANCGGLLGLFLGFSFLSLVEIIYFLTLRIVCNLMKKLWPVRSSSGRRSRAAPDGGNFPSIIHVNEYRTSN